MFPAHVLSDPDYCVPEVDSAERGVAWLRSQVVRFSNGGEHRRRRRLVEELLEGIAPDRLRRGGDHVATLAEALGLSRSICRDVRLVAEFFQPHLAATPEADAALERLVAVCGGTKDDATAATICVLVQACDATSRLVAGDDPPVLVTRRVAPSGQIVEVGLADTPFGVGPHACPGRAHALALAEGVTEFRRLHDEPNVLILPNAWDMASASSFIAAGFPAIGTTSLGVASSAWLPDGHGRTHDVTIELATRLVGLGVPITVDVENGWVEDPAELAACLWELGVAGLNLEDGHGMTLADPDRQARRISAMKQAAPQMFINARIDTWWLGRDHDSTNDRAQIYASVGADGVFVPGADEATVAAVEVPVNTLADRPISMWRLALERLT